MMYAICNEMFEGWAHADVARAVSGLGYRGIEIAPFTLGPSPAELPGPERDGIRGAFASRGIEIVGLHWLLKNVEGVSLTSPDDGTLARTAGYMRKLIELCRDLNGTVMVVGSPQQRLIAPGQDPEDAWARATRLFREVAPLAGDAGITICFEPLTAKETNFVNTMAEGVRLVERVGHPAFRLHLDVKAMAGAEAKPPADVIREEGGRHLRHFHANDTNLLGPGMGETDFDPIAGALKDVGYNRWISVETFTPGPGPEETARRSIATMRRAFEED